MKNSPERSFNDEFDKRIASYSEMPDDVVWNNIDKALRPNRMLVLMAWWDRATSLFLVSLVLGTALILSENDAIPREYSHRVADSTPEKPGADSEMGKAREVTPMHPRSPNKKPVGSQIPDLLKPSVVGESVVTNYASADSSETQLIPVSQPRNLVSAESLIEQPLIDSLLHDEIVEKTADENVAEKKSSHWLPFKNIKIFAAATPMINFHQVVPISGDGVGITGVESPSILSSDRLSVSISVGLQGYISHRFEYYGGLTFFRKKTSLRYSVLSEEIVTELDPLRYSIVPEHSTGEFNYKTTNVGLQGGMLFHLYGKKLMHKVGAGLLYHKGFADSSNEELYKEDHSDYLSYEVFYRNEIVINRRLKFFVQPTFTNSFYVSEKLKEPFKLQPYSAGIGFGAIFQLD